MNVFSMGILSLFICSCWNVACGGMVALHDGDVDPTTEGWSINTIGASATIGPINDGGIFAWTIDDDSATDRFLYTQSVSNQDISDGNALGWRLSVELRMTEAPLPAFVSSQSASYRDGTTSYQLGWGIEANNDVYVMLIDGSFASVPFGATFSLAGSGGGYHRYDLIYDPIAGNADLFVDNVEVLSDYIGFGLAQQFVGFGAFSTQNTGAANWGRVDLQTIPEPSSFVFLLLGFILAGRNFLVRR